MLDDLQHAAVAVLASARRQHSPVPGGVVEHRGDGRGRVAVGDDGSTTSWCSVSCAEQRRVAGQHDDGRVVVEVVAGDRRHADHRCVAGAALHGLLDEGHVRPAGRLLLHLLGDPLGAVADDHDRAIDVDLGQGVDDVHDHGPAADLCSGFGRAERIREPSPAASTIAETVIRPF